MELDRAHLLELADAALHLRGLARLRPKAANELLQVLFLFFEILRAILEKLPLLGISGVANLLMALKFA